MRVPQQGCRDSAAVAIQRVVRGHTGRQRAEAVRREGKWVEGWVDWWACGWVCVGCMWGSEPVVEMQWTVGTTEGSTDEHLHFRVASP